MERLTIHKNGFTKVLEGDVLEEAMTIDPSYRPGVSVYGLKGAGHYVGTVIQGSDRVLVLFSPQDTCDPSENRLDVVGEFIESVRSHGLVPTVTTTKFQINLLTGGRIQMDNEALNGLTSTIHDLLQQEDFTIQT